MMFASALWNVPRQKEHDAHRARGSISGDGLVDKGREIGTASADASQLQEVSSIKHGNLFVEGEGIGYFSALR